MMYLSEWNEVWTAIATDSRFAKDFAEHVGEEWRMLNFSSNDVSYLKQLCKRKIHYLTTFRDANGMTLVYDKNGEPFIADQQLQSRLSSLQLMKRMGRDEKIGMRQAQKLDQATLGKGFKSR